MKTISLFYGFLVVLTTVSMLFFMDFSIMGFGLGGFCFSLVAIPTLISCRFTGYRSLPLSVTIVCLSVGFFISVAAFSGIVAGNLGYLDFRHLISMLALPAWIGLGGLLAARNPRLLEWIGAWIFTGISVLVILVAIVLLVAARDVSFLRSDVSMTGLLTKTCFSNPNVLARLSLVLLAVQVILAVERNGIARYFRSALSVGLACVILLTGSRANIVAMLPILACLALFLGRRGRLVLGGSVAMMGVLALATDFGQERVFDLIELLESRPEKSLDMERTRIRAHSVALSIISDHPLAGVGLEIENDLLATRGSLSFSSASGVIVPHGTLLKLAVRYGLLATLAFVAAVGVFAYALLRREPDEAKGVNAGRSSYRKFGIAILFSVAISSLAADTFGQASTELVVAWVLAMKTVMPHTDEEMS